MTRLFFVLLLSAGSTCAFAFDWPWQERPEERLEYCKGFLVSSLGAFPVDGLSRTHMWLDWNYVIAAAPGPQDFQAPDYLEGKEFFQARLEADDVEAILNEAEGVCALGRL